MSSVLYREQALAIWQAAVEAVRPEPLVRAALASEQALKSAQRILVVGAGKAGARMAVGVEATFSEQLDKLVGVVNIPEGTAQPLSRIRLHTARPQGLNEPTAAGVQGTHEMIELLESAGPEDVAICLLSGGGSALLPAPAAGLELADKQLVTQLLHRAGVTIDEMNCVRKHLSRVKGGQLARYFRGKSLLSLIISDVVGDPLDVIASGPTASDPSTYSDAIAVLTKHKLLDRIPHSAIQHLQAGSQGLIPETPKLLPSHVVNRVIGSNRIALNAAKRTAESLGYRVLDLGAFIEGETQQMAIALAGVVRSIRHQSIPLAPPVCVLLGGETTVTLNDRPGKGGRNQEFVLAMLLKLGERELPGVTILSGGTDGEDGPTDAAGAVADLAVLRQFEQLGLSAVTHLQQHDAYPLFNNCNALIKPGLTGTNVMDVRVILINTG